jgi:hypothetical protein
MDDEEIVDALDGQLRMQRRGTNKNGEKQGEAAQKSHDRKKNRRMRREWESGKRLALGAAFTNKKTAPARADAV